jgi:2-hydroxychromene-2-carboxylate isomerase
MSISQLQQVVEDSGLSQSDKDLWLHALELMDDEQAQAIMESVGDDPEELEAFTRNLKLKQVAFASGDRALMDQILEEETEEIQRL